MDVVKSEYGYTHAQVGLMTLRELDSAMRQINRRTHGKIQLEFALRGIKLPDSLAVAAEKSEDEVAFTEEEDAQMERALLAAQKRKQEEMRARG